MQETTDLGSANRTLVGLHSDNLATIDAEAHMPTWQNDGVFTGRIADYAFLLTFICDISSIIINSINIV